MEIKSTLTNRSGQTLDVIYREDDPLEDLEGKVLQSARAFCFYEGKLVAHSASLSRTDRLRMTPTAILRK